MSVTNQLQASWIRNFNGLLAPNAQLWPAPAGVYEPLLIYSTMKGEYVPWLATDYAWFDGNKRLTFSLRPGVFWSDGHPFSARDVVFTFELLKKHRALDLHNDWSHLEGIEAKGDLSVELSFNRPYVPGFHYIAQQTIVAEHVWKNVADPVTFTDEHPVGTGPFTEVRVFQNQVYELGANPRYWQKGKPAIKGVRLSAYPGNDQATIALLGGEVDWGGTFIPDIERVYVKRAPDDYHYWAPLVNGTVMLYANTMKPPFDDVRVRKALSLAIDRAQIVKVAVYGASRGSDATGLNDAYARWRSPAAVAAGDWVTLDPARAERMLDEAGLRRGPDGVRTLRNGAPFRVDVNVVTGWSDWVRTAQIIAQNLRQIGIEATLRAYDFNAWFQKVQKGEFDLSIGWTVDGPTPYTFYLEIMSSQTVKPIGEASPNNWNRFSTPEADALFRAFEATSDPDEQRKLIDRMQMIFVENAPSIPIYPGPAWGEFNTAHFTGFPSQEDPYARLPPYFTPEYLLVLTRLVPVHDGAASGPKPRAPAEPQGE